ncbi:glycoside hydrolase [Macrophomina phaseolina]|uniref:chitinase n=1 Tax=Macrophomina phaseolina TaxID=35725 RepID=A0ABQ8GQQ6_9PEZI|nr:glycoside hydrolase [Macrophomina phaseolina]
MTPAPIPSDCSVPAPTKAVPPEPSPHAGFVHGAYYPSWKVYRKQPPSCMNLRVISHVFYAFVRVREDGTAYHLDEKADTQLPVDGTAGCLHALTKLRTDSHPNVKLLLSVGGGSGSKPFPALAASATARQTLAHSLRAFVDRFAFDGVDIDWEHPTTPADGTNYVHLLAALRAALPAPAYLLTAALPAGEWCLRNIPLGALSAHLDHLNLMCYDFAGPWTPRAGHHAQLFAPPHPVDAYAQRSGHGAVEYVLARGVAARKIVMGVPVYGRSFLGVKGAGEKFSGHGGDAGGVFEYRELPREGASLGVDERVVGAMCSGGDGGWVSYDSPETVARKARYVRERGLGGLFYWTGVMDKEGEGSLLLTGYEGLYGKESDG